MEIKQPRLKTKVKSQHDRYATKKRSIKEFSLINTHHDKYGLKMIQCGQAAFYSNNDYDLSYLESIKQIVAAYNRNQNVLFVFQRYPDGLDVMRVA